MEAVALGFMLFFVATGLLLAGLSVPLILRWVKPNGIYGFRTPKTLSDERIWYDANAYAGRALLAVGGGYVAASVVFYFVFRPDFVAYNITCTAVILGGLLVATLLSFRYLRSL
jgi:uncharacterized membrane protein